MGRAICLLVFTSLLIGVIPARAEDVPSQAVPSKHQLMKDCMAKQKASDGGMPKEDMKKNCKDVTKTEEENDKVEKATEQSEDAAKN